MKQRLKKQDTGFTQIKNAVLNNKDLSLKAKGLFAYIYSKPDNWDFSADRIASDMKDGADCIRTTIKELEDNGYLVRKKLSSGRIVYNIYFDKKPIREKAKLVKSQVGKIHSISNKDNKVIKNNKIIKNVADKSATNMSLKEFVDYCKKSNNRHIQIIGDYAEEKKLRFETKQQWDQFLRRNLKPARVLSDYSEKQMAEAIEKIYRTDYLGNSWTLETLIKFLDK